VEKIVVTEFLTLLVNINLILEQETQEIRTDMVELQRVLDETQDYLDQIHIADPQDPDSLRLIALIHAFDHMQRLHERCDEDLDRAVTASRSMAVSDAETIMDMNIDRIIEAVEAGEWDRGAQFSQQGYQQIHDLERPLRDKIYHAVARGSMGVSPATNSVEAIRWMTRVSRHISRICFYLQQVNQ
jgi:phosphate:Na+ symporter